MRTEGDLIICNEDGKEVGYSYSWLEALYWAREAEPGRRWIGFAPEIYKGKLKPIVRAGIQFKKDIW